MKLISILILVEICIGKGIVFNLSSKYNNQLADYLDKDGSILYSVSTFGNFLYSEIVNIQIIVPNFDNILGCNRLEHPEIETKQFAWLFMRGDCNYVTKAKRAQESGALVVFVYHEEYLKNVDNIIPSGEDINESLNVPVILIQKEVGEILKQAYSEGENINAEIDLSPVYLLDK